MNAWLITSEGEVELLGASIALSTDGYKLAKPYVKCEQCDYVEHVRVLFKEKICSMFVNEEGMLHDLPINARATLIYLTATIQGRTGTPFNPLSDPLIYGNAVLFDNIARS